MLQGLSGRSFLWWVNEFGILLEIVGAIVIVVAAFRTRARIKSVQDTWDSELSILLRDMLATQAFTELTGFVLLALGLFGQLIAGFQ